MGKKSKKENNANKKQMPKTQKKKRHYFGQIVLAIILSVTILMLYVNRKRIIYHRVKNWNYEEIMKSPENLRQYTEYLLLGALPKEYNQEDGLVLMPYENLGDDLKYFVQERMPLQWDLICRARELLKSNTFKIIYIPDKHSESLSGKWSQEGLECQIQIKQRILELKPGIALVEGFNRSLITKESIYQEVNKFCQRTGMIAPSKNEFMKTYNDSKEWWAPFIGNTFIKLFGADEMELNNIWFRLYEISQKRTGKEKKLLQKIATSFNLYWRDLVIIAGAVETMHENNVNEAVLVLGFAHARTLPNHCKRLGIEFQQIDP